MDNEDAIDDYDDIKQVEPLRAYFPKFKRVAAAANMPIDDNRTIRHFLNSLTSSIKPKIRAEQLQSMRTAMVGADFDTLEEAYTAARNHERKLIATAKAIGYETYMGPATGSYQAAAVEDEDAAERKKFKDEIKEEIRAELTTTLEPITRQVCHSDCSMQAQSFNA